MNSESSDPICVLGLSFYEHAMWLHALLRRVELVPDLIEVLLGNPKLSGTDGERGRQRKVTVPWRYALWIWQIRRGPRPSSGFVVLNGSNWTRAVLQGSCFSSTTGWSVLQGLDDEVGGRWVLTVAGETGIEGCRWDGYRRLPVRWVSDTCRWGRYRMALLKLQTNIWLT